MSKTAGTIPNILSSNLRINGNIISEGDVQIEGQVVGDIIAVGVVIGEKADICGDIYGRQVQIQGRIRGNVIAQEVGLSASAVVSGNVIYNGLAILNGAQIVGNLTRDANLEQKIQEQIKKHISDNKTKNAETPTAK